MRGASWLFLGILVAVTLVRPGDAHGSDPCSQLASYVAELRAMKDPIGTLPDAERKLAACRQRARENTAAAMAELRKPMPPNHPLCEMKYNSWKSDYDA